MSTHPALTSAAALCPDALAAPLAAYLAPWRVVVVGRTGSGKSALVNALAGATVQQTGLGGVTADVTELAVGGAILVDTPGLDVADPPLAADAVLWVVDGLQPLTLTEREAMEALPAGTPLHVLVSRSDLLDPADGPEVLARVRALTAAHAPRTVALVTLRGSPDVPAGLLDPDPERRRAPLRAALTAVVDALPPDPGDATELLAAARLRWRAAVRSAERTTLDAVDRGELWERHRAVARWVEHATAAVDAFVTGLVADPALGALVASGGAPELPRPATRESGILGAVLDSMGGEHAAIREVRAVSGRWLAEGDVVLSDWITGIGLPDAHGRARNALVRTTVQAALHALAADDG